MSLLKITRIGHPVLLEKAQRVSDPTAPEIQRLISDMIETMDDSGGVGLAAPQVHVPLRLFVFRLPSLPEEQHRVVINPVISPSSDETESAWEGCLSIPDFRGFVPRFTEITYTGMDRDGKELNESARDMHARIVQHENDHLDGILYTMRMDGMKLFGFDKELRQNGVVK